MKNYQVAAMQAAPRNKNFTHGGGSNGKEEEEEEEEEGGGGESITVGSMGTGTLISKSTLKSTLGLTSKQNIKLPKTMSAAAADSPANVTLVRPPTTQSMNSTGSPQIWEQEVDDLLKWTEGLQQSDSDPLDQSWGPGMSP